MRRIATIGFFDGVHRGHQFLFGRLQDEAHKRGLAPLIVSFDTHPREVLQMGYQPRLLSSTQERKAMLSRYAEVLLFDFRQIRMLTAEQFMQRLHEEQQVDALLVGYDHRFGSDRIQDIDTLQQIGRQVGIQVIKAEEYATEQAHISSTEIRNAIQAGDLELANRLLGYPYRLSGTVVHGRGIGHTLGFPTANIRLAEPKKLLPPCGVYAVRADLGHGHTRAAILNIGTNPTLGENPVSIELHIPELRLDLYDRELSVALLRFLRAEQRFDSLEALSRQIQEDIRQLDGI